ncbi:protein SDA1 homolog [Bradysia coprophila]|uniref:protein SDA1 homolog n=1 Tax=Bradysia coprophila TaxID=38358 RepID=UPI00187DB7BB|nr:protein SDA1 homolog [Bradysia coprophila]
MRHNNQLPNNLPQLQNLIKRDPESYREEFLQQYRHFQSLVEIFRLNPAQENKSLDELVIFLAQVAQCYVEELLTFPQQIVDLLKHHSTTLDPGMRNTFCKALILLRNKNLIAALDLLELFFQLLRCPDKSLRSFLENHIITDIKNMNAKHKDMKLNSTLQNFMYTMLKDSNPKAAKMSIDIMIELYKKNIWNDAKTVNAIANVGCFSNVTKVMVASLKFFLGTDPEEGSDNSDSENEPDLKNAMLVNRVNKKTKKRQKQLKEIKKQVVKAKKKKSKAEPFNFSGVHLIHNPQGMAENLFKQLQAQNERFEVKLLHLDVISRLIGIHDLFLFTFYPYITRFLQPHQRQVTRILQFAAQASHELVPGEVIEPVLKTIANNFITERNSSDVMAIGLNATREICSRCPLSMGEDLLRDLVMYKTYKEKSVMMAARSLMTLFRERLPELLHRKDRGRPTEAQVENKPKAYGEVVALDSIPGAEVLLKQSEQIDMSDDSDASESEDGWVDMKDDGNNEIDDDEDEEEGDDEEGEDDDEDDEEDEDDVEEDGSEDEKDQSTNDVSEAKAPVILDEKQAAQELAITRLFTDEDFKRIDMENIKKHTKGARKRPLEQEKSEYVRLNDIEMIFKKKKHDKEARLETVLRGRTGRDKFGYKDGRKNENCSKTNREKRKRKNFGMMRNKARSKVKKSFKEKQQSMRKHLLKQKKMK